MRTKHRNKRDKWFMTISDQLEQTILIQNKNAKQNIVFLQDDESTVQPNLNNEPLGPWKFVRDMGSSSHWGLTVTSGQEANGNNLGILFLSSRQ